MIGRLVEFHDGEGQARLYTIEWENEERKDQNNCIIDDDDGTRVELSSESTTQSISNRSACMYSERWTESRVAIGILLDRCMGLKAAKFFDTDIFIGQVVNVHATATVLMRLLKMMEIYFTIFNTKMDIPKILMRKNYKRG